MNTAPWTTMRGLELEGLYPSWWWSLLLGRLLQKQQQRPEDPQGQGHEQQHLDWGVDTLMGHHPIFCQRLHGTQQQQVFGGDETSMGKQRDLCFPCLAMGREVWAMLMADKSAVLALLGDATSALQQEVRLRAPLTTALRVPVVSGSLPSIDHHA